MKRLLAGLLFLGASFLGANEYHATTSGSGTTCSSGTPCNLHTLMTVKTLVAGDIGWVHGGTYTPTIVDDFVVKTNATGAAGNPVIFRNWNNEHVIINCDTNVGNLCFGDHGSSTPGQTEHIRWWGFDIRNLNNTEVRSWETGTVTVTNGSPTVTLATPDVVGYTWLCSNPANSIPCNIPSGGEGMNIKVGIWPDLGIAVTVRNTSCSVIDPNDATKCKTPGTTLTLTAPVPAGTCPDANPCTVRALYPMNECCNANNLQGIYLANNDTGYINCYFRDQTDGTLTNDNYGGAKIIRGSYYQYNGETGNNRSYGHSLYLGNPFDGTACNNTPAGPGTGYLDCTNGEAGRTVLTGNVQLRAFQIETQMYHGGGNLSYITLQDSVLGPSGYPNFFNTTGWPAYSFGQQWYMGDVTATVTTGCPTWTNPPTVPNPTGSTKTASYDQWLNNTFFTDSTTPFQMGGSKGSCGATFSGNYVDGLDLGDGQLNWLRVIGNGIGAGKNGCPVGSICGTYGPVTITGNTFMYPDGNGTGGPGPPDFLFTKANFPSNTWNAALPTTNRVRYWASPDEPGFGYVAISNFQNLANVTIDPTQMGCVAGTPYNFYNWQQVEPWDDSLAVASQTGCSPISVPTTATKGIARPAFLNVDKVSLFPIPPDIGPRFVTILMRPKFSSIAGTPTPTNTPSLTPTNTVTPSRTPTFTPSFTPSNTPSRTPTFTPSTTPSFSATPSNTPSASATPTPSNTATFTPSPTFTASVTPTRTPTPSGGGGFSSFPFSQCTITAPMVLTTGVADYPSSYVSSPTTNSGQVSCPFTVGSTGTYRVWIKAQADDSTHDSFFVDVDGDGSGSSCLVDGTATCNHIFDAAEQIQPCQDDGTGQSCIRNNFWGPAPYYNPLNDRTTTDCGLCHSSNSIERRLSLTAGAHTISFRAREAGAKLYYVTITSDLNFEPADPAPTPTPRPLTHAHCCCHGKRIVHNHPYTGPHTHPCP